MRYKDLRKINKYINKFMWGMKNTNQRDSYCIFQIVYLQVLNTPKQNSIIFLEFIGISDYII